MFRKHGIQYAFALSHPTTLENADISNWCNTAFEKRGKDPVALILQSYFLLLPDIDEFRRVIACNMDHIATK